MLKKRVVSLTILGVALLAGAAVLSGRLRKRPDLKVSEKFQPQVQLMETRAIPD